MVRLGGFIIVWRTRTYEATNSCKERNLETASHVMAYYKPVYFGLLSCLDDRHEDFTNGYSSR